MDFRVIDIHTHPTFFGDHDSLEEVGRIVDYGKSFGVEHMVILGDVLLYGRNPTPQQVRSINDKTAEVISWYPEYFSGLCFLNPLLGSEFVREETDRCVKDLGFKGFKLEICNNARDRVMNPVMEQAAKLGVFVLQHTADQTNIKQRSFHTDPTDTAILGRRFPEVPIIMAHLTSCGLRGVREIEDVPNVVIDTSAFLPQAGLVEYAVQHLGVDRVLYGSDLVIRDLPSQIGRIVAADLPREQKQRILFDNAARMLGIEIAQTVH